MSDSNVGLGMVPCGKNCRCDDCTIRRLQAEVKRLEAKNDELQIDFDLLQAECDGYYQTIQKVRDTLNDKVESDSEGFHHWIDPKHIWEIVGEKDEIKTKRGGV